MNSIRVLATRVTTPNLAQRAIFVRYSHAPQLTFEEFDKKWTDFFREVDDVFELRRGLERAFEEDLVPSPQCCEAAIRAARRVNDYTLAVRVVDALKYKCPTSKDFNNYLAELKPVMTELGVDNPVDLRF